MVNELMAATPEASAALWRFCFDLDLYERTEAARRPTDDPLPWMLADPRRLQRSTRDGLWSELSKLAPLWSSGPMPPATVWCWKSATTSANGTRGAGASSCRQRAAFAGRYRRRGSVNRRIRPGVGVPGGGQFQYLAAGGNGGRGDFGHRPARRTGRSLCP